MFDVPSIYLPDLIDGHASTSPRKLALVCDDGTMTWAAFAGATAAFARYLAARGLGRGDRVAVLAEPTLQSIIAQFGALRAGASVASLSGMASGAALARMLVDSEAKALIVDDHFSGMLDSILADVPGGIGRFRLRIGRTAAGWSSFSAAVEEGQSLAPVPFPRIEREDEFVILYSSGTTGIPKGIVLSHGCRLANCYVMAIEKRYDSRAVVFSATALYSNTTWTLLTLAFCVGGTAVVMRKFEAKAALALMERWRVSHTVLVPAVLRMILEADGDNRANLDSVKTLCTTGSAMPLPLKRQAIRRFPGAYYEIYGLTEGLALILKPEDAEAHLDSVGKPLLGNDIRIVDDAGACLPPGEKGEIVGYGPLLMRGYNCRPDATEEAIWREPATGRTFLRSGDIGYFDTDGFLHLVDRKKDMLVSGGYNVYPADIERIIVQHPSVLEATVIGVPHEKWGETPVAYVVDRPGIEAPTPEELQRWVNAQVGKHERISGVVRVAALPRNAGGKILKRELREAHVRAAPAQAEPR